MLLLRQTFGPEAWPDVSDETLFASLEQWLSPWLAGMSRAEHLVRLDLKSALEALLGWAYLKKLEQLAPTHLEVPSGSKIRIDYAADGPPVLAVRLQEMFGLAETPKIAENRVELLLHLLSPAMRPVQVTRDLKNFWQTTYHEVKKELKARYPKHSWPDDPWKAEPTRRVKRKT